MHTTALQTTAFKTYASSTRSKQVVTFTEDSLLFILNEAIAVSRPHYRDVVDAAASWLLFKHLGSCESLENDRLLISVLDA